MAGVTGPCPNCSQQITAPAQPSAAAPELAPQQQAAPSASAYQPTPVGYQPTPVSQRQAQPAPQQIPNQPAPVQQQPQPVNPLQQQHGAVSQQPQPQVQATALPPLQAPAPQAQKAPPLQPAAMPSQEHPSMTPPSKAAHMPGDEPMRERRSESSRSRQSRSGRRSRSDGPSSQAASPTKKLIGMLAGAAVLLVGGTLATPKIKEMLNNSTLPAPQPEHVNRDVPDLGATPKGSTPATPRTSDEQHLVNNTPPILEDKPPVPPLEDEPPAQIEGILDPPRDFLTKYITSPTWNDMLEKSVGGKSLEKEMAAYYKQHPYQPEKLVEMAFQHKQKLPKSDREFYLFKVVTESNKRSFPMTVEETDDGYRTDWLTYVQFKDMHLQKFLEKPDIDKSTGKGATQVFNVILRRAHDFTDEVPDSENKWCYRIDAPNDAANAEELGGYSFIPKHSNYGQELDLKLKWLLSYFPIVELRWEVDPDYPKRPYVRLMKIRQFNWRGHDANAETLETVSAGQDG